MLIDVPYYVELQRRMFDIFRYVSCHEKNFPTHSVMLESLLIGAASLFDSQCQTFIREKSLAKQAFKREGEVKDFKKKVEGSEDFNCGDYRALLEGDFALSKRTVNLNPYEEAMVLNPMSFDPNKINSYPIGPFKEWSANESLPWWNVFTNLKHDRLKHHKEATLINTILALAASYIILTLQNEVDFKQGHISPELYDLFFPQYWQWHGRTSVMSYLFK